MDYATHTKLEFRRSFWVLAGAKITVVDPASEAVVGFIKMKAWTLKEDIRLFADESMQVEIFRIHARSIIDFGATYDVTESTTEKPLFSWRRKGLKSMFVRDHWDLLDADGQHIGNIRETSSGLALVRRWIGIIPLVGEIIDLALSLSFAPQTYRISALQDGKEVYAGALTHRKNPFVVKMSLDTSAAEANLDPHVAVSAAALLSTVDASKE